MQASQRLVRLLEESNIELKINKLASKYLKVSEKKDFEARAVKGSFLLSLYKPRAALRNLDLSAKKRELIVEMKDSLSAQQACQSVFPKILEEYRDSEAKKLSLIQNELYRLMSTLKSVEEKMQQEGVLNASYWLPWRKGHAGDFQKILTECKELLSSLLKQCDAELEQCIADHLTVVEDSKISNSR